MRRREFITLVGGAAATWPVVARAQQVERVRHVVVLLSPGSDYDLESHARVAAFTQALSALGWIEDRNLRLVTRVPKPTAADIRKHVAEVVAAAPDLVLTTGSTTVGPFLQANRTIPLVFVSVVDPVGAGFVESLAHPGGNATGFMQFEYGVSGKWLEFLKQIAPTTTRAAVIQGAGLNRYDAVS